MAVILRCRPGEPLEDATLSRRLEAICERESCLVIAKARQAESPLGARPMMLATARGGREWYSLERRRLAVDDDNLLLLSEGREHSSVIRCENEVETFRIFFRRGLARDVLTPLVTAAERLLDRGPADAGPGFELTDGLRSHDRRLSPVLAYIRYEALSGNNDVAWFEEQLACLLERLLMAQRDVVRRANAIPCARPGTRREIHRRVTMAVDYIESAYEQQVELEGLAQVACLSKFHFLRAFRSVQGVTPQQYLQRKRAAVAKRLLTTTALPAAEIALRIGYSSRTSLTKQVRQWTGMAPAELRRRIEKDAPLSERRSAQLASAAQHATPDVSVNFATD